MIDLLTSTIVVDVSLSQSWVGTIVIQTKSLRPWMKNYVNGIIDFDSLDCEPKGIIYRITLLLSELLVDLYKCECDRMNGSSLVISQLLLYLLMCYTKYYLYWYCYSPLEYFRVPTSQVTSCWKALVTTHLINLLSCKMGIHGSSRKKGTGSKTWASANNG